MNVQKSLLVAVLAAALFAGAARAAEDAAKPKKDSGEGYISLFDGKSLDGWKISTDKPDAIIVEDGMIVCRSGRAHLYYDGPVENHNFKNFHLQLDVMTTPGSNSGVYFHTEYQEEGWPAKGYECQVNNTHSDWRKTGGLYAIVDVKDNSPVKDNEWFHYDIIVRGKHVVLKINGKTTAEYTEPENVERDPKMAGRVISSGTIALQAHDPKSKTFYKNIKIKPLKD